MKKLLPLIGVLGCLAQPVMANNSISTLGALSQTQFRSLSEDLSSALSYKGVTPTAPLGVTGFDLGIGVSRTDMAQSSALWSKITSSGNSVGDLYVPKLHIAKGLPLGFDVAGFYSKVSSTGFTLVGAEVRYAIIDGGIAKPALGLRGAYSKMSGVSQLALNTRSLDISLSKGFAMLTPYIGAGQVWTNSSPNAGTLTNESISQHKYFAGANLNLGFTNIAAEWDKTGVAKTISIKLGFRF